MNLAPTGIELAEQKPKGVPRLRRARADAMVAAIVAAAVAINADPAMLHDVWRLTVFGSWLGDKPLLGDLDIAFELKARCTGDAFAARIEAFNATCPPPRSTDWLCRLGWPEKVAMRRLRVGRNISLHPHDDLDRCGFPSRALMASGERVA